MISYTAELHNTWTVDGFELGIHRIKPKNDGAKPVFLMHGLFTDAMCWVANLPINDLAFMLSDSGYDVWIGEFLIIKTGNRKKKETHVAPNILQQTLGFPLIPRSTGTGVGLKWVPLTLLPWSTTFSTTLDIPKSLWSVIAKAVLILWLPSALIQFLQIK